MMRAIAVLALLVPLVLGSEHATADQTDTTLAEISRQLTRAPVMRATFRQERTLRALQRPLITEGRLVFVEHKGALWRLATPYKIDVLVTATEVVEWEEGAPPRRVALAANPVFRALSDVFLAALAGNVAALGQEFSVQAALEGAQWRLNLAPQKSALAAVFSRVEVDGGRFVETVRFVEASGDETVIGFTDFAVGSSGLDAAEAGFFND